MIPNPGVNISSSRILDGRSTSISLAVTFFENELVAQCVDLPKGVKLLSGACISVTSILSPAPPLGVLP